MNRNWKWINFINVESIAELLQWIALDCTSAPNTLVNEEISECMLLLFHGTLTGGSVSQM